MPDLQDLLSPEYDGPFPRLQGFCLWIASGVVMRIPVEVKFGDAFFRRKDVCDKAGSQCHAEFSGIEILIVGIPDLVKTERVLLPAGPDWASMLNTSGWLESHFLKI